MMTRRSIFGLCLAPMVPSLPPSDSATLHYGPKWFWDKTRPEAVRARAQMDANRSYYLETGEWPEEWKRKYPHAYKWLCDSRSQCPDLHWSPGKWMSATELPGARYEELKRVPQETNSVT